MTTMTGHRRRKGAPLKADQHAQSSWAHFQQMLADATTPERRVGVVDGYLRAALNTHRQGWRSGQRPNTSPRHWSWPAGSGTPVWPPVGTPR